METEQNSGCGLPVILMVPKDQVRRNYENCSVVMVATESAVRIKCLMCSLLCDKPQKNAGDLMPALCETPTNRRVVGAEGNPKGPKG